MDDRLLMIVLRLLHVVGGLFWVGAMLVASGFLYPAARSLPAGGQLLERVMVRQRLSAWLSAAAGTTVLTGLVMYGRVAMSDGGTAWMGTRPGIAFGLGGVLAITAAAIAGAVIVPSGKRLTEIGARVGQAGGAPSPSDAAAMQRLQARMFATSRAVAVMLVLAACAMAVARYL